MRKRNFKDFTGLRFERWLVKGFANHIKGVAYWTCICDCGQLRTVNGGTLSRGESKSCGCIRAEKVKAYGAHSNGKQTVEYSIYSTMLARCYNLNTKNYHRYGGRGIKVCERWRESFTNFLNDMGHRPSDDHSIDRIDTNGNYCPENCRWATLLVQMNNRPDNLQVTFNGITKTLAEWARELPFKYATLFFRLKKGWPVEKAFSQPLEKHTKKAVAA